MPANKPQSADRPWLIDLSARFVNFINSWRMTPAEAKVEEMTAALPPNVTIDVMGTKQHASVMGIPSSEANFLALLTRLLADNSHKIKAIDIGTFTGRSALAIAQAMPNGGEVIACEIDKRFERIAEECWAAAGEKISKRITLAHGKAQDTLDDLIRQRESGTFDLIFIDADKPNYPLYYEKALELLRPGGLVLLDNMLWSRRVVLGEFTNPRSPDYDPSADTLLTLNEDIAKSKNVDATLLSFEDGVMVVQKRERQRGPAYILDKERHDEADQRHTELLHHLGRSVAKSGR